MALIKNTNSLLILSSLIIFLTFPATVFCTQADAGLKIVGKVVAARGNAIAVDTDAVERSLKIKAPIYLKDTIKTNNGRLQILFKDRTIITLGKKTELLINKYLWQPGDSNSAMETNIKEGSFRIMGGSITRTAPDNFKTTTPSGTIGIRGSMYAGFIADSLLEVFFQGGKGIFVKNDFGSVEIDRPGFATRITDKFSPPEKPKKADPKRLDQLENALAQTPEAEQTSEQQRGGDNNQSGTQTIAPSENPPEDGGTVMAGSEMPAEDTPGSTIPLNETISDSGGTNDFGNTDTIGSFDSPDNIIVAPPPAPPPVEAPEITDPVIVPALSLSTSVPTSGIWIYKGTIIDQLEDHPSDTIALIVNWDTKKIMGLEDETAVSSYGPGTGFAFGTISSSAAIENVTAYGSEGLDNNSGIFAFTGGETYGQFFGDNTQELFLAMEGYDINLQDDSDQHFWQDNIKAQVVNKYPNSYSGSETWNGFFIGGAEDMANINTNRRVFTNSDASQFALSISKDTGTLSGSMSGIDYNNGSNTLSLNIGGNSTEYNKSAYITDNLIGAKIDGTGAAIVIGANTGGLKAYGNYLRSSNVTQLSSYTKWGYWEIAYSEPGTNKDYHLHVPGAMWIAGKQDTNTFTGIANRLNTSFTATYTGKAQGVMIDNNNISQLHNGVTNLNFDFSSVASTPIQGNISFDEKAFSVTGYTGAIYATGFSAQISGDAGSKVSGTFYGNDVNGIGGNFSTTQSGIQYHGIFAGDR